MSESAYDIGIIGGGLAGLSTAILSARKGYTVVLFERDTYPRHKVCGEYVSQESRRFMEELGLDIAAMDLPEIDRFRITSMHGHIGECDLDPGGIGISRYLLDAELARIATEEGVDLRQGVTVRSWSGDERSGHRIESDDETVHVRLMVAAWGRNPGAVDKARQRAERQWVGVKYHVDRGPERNVIEIHPFPGGYAGISQVEEGKYCLCYLCDAEQLKRTKGNIAQLEEEVLSSNEALAERLSAKRLFDPVTTSQFSFSARRLSSVLRLGDAQGFIPPLTGNGMSLAFRGAKEHAHIIDGFLSGTYSSSELRDKRKAYNSYLGNRIRSGVVLQDILLTQPRWLNRILMGAFTGSPVLLKHMTKRAVGSTI